MLAHGLNGRPWTQGTVSLFLRKPRNAGLREHNDEIMGNGNWPALVDESTWRAAQTVLNAPGREPGRKAVPRHLLTGVLGCGAEGCGEYLSGQETNAGTIRYSCKRATECRFSPNMSSRCCSGSSAAAGQARRDRAAAGRIARPGRNREATHRGQRPAGPAE